MELFDPTTDMVDADGPPDAVEEKLGGDDR
jgi:hypothetical protein